MREHHASYQRLFFASAAAVASIVFVMAKGHVQVDLSDVATYRTLLIHRCAWAMLACLGWAVVEMTLMLRAYDPAESFSWVDATAFPHRA